MIKIPKNFFGRLLIIFPLLAIGVPVFAYVASSQNYRLQSDSINFAGQLSTSTNYKIEDTLGEIATGNSSSVSYNLKAGYQAMSDDVFLTLTPPATDLNLSPSIDTSVGGTALGSATWTVETNSPSGYTLGFSADSLPAFRISDDYFSDLSVSPSSSLYSWSVSDPNSAFGYSADGVDIVSKFLDNGTTCGIALGSDSSDKCWTSFNSTDETVAERYSATPSGGVSTTIKFRAETTAGRALKAGSYHSTISALAVVI